ncbi:MAG: ABC transporter ATP-binding protein [Chlorobiaceae bacterium]|nr:ABC transporter ATP-binding protein [Chlorobiaceae bacterium]
MLEIRNLNAGYGEMPVLKSVSLSVSKGEILSIVGSNGAGKSTLLKSISGVVRASGSMDFLGAPIVDLKPHEIVRRGIVHVPEGRKIFPELTVSENLRMGAFLNPQHYRSRIEMVFDLFPRLAERPNQLGGTMSGGEQQMLAIARGLMGDPKLLMLDEPSLGLSPLYAETVFRSIGEINRNGVTVLLVEQNVFLSLSISNRGYVIETGSVVLTGSGQELLENPQVKKAFLGM